MATAPRWLLIICYHDSKKIIALAFVRDMCFHVVIVMFTIRHPDLLCAYQGPFLAEENVWKISNSKACMCSTLSPCKRFNESKYRSGDDSYCIDHSANCPVDVSFTIRLVDSALCLGMRFDVQWMVLLAL
jgi:hypothetical protein